MGISADGKKLATASWNTVILFDIILKRQIRVWTVSNTPLSCIHFNPAATGIYIIISEPSHIVFVDASSGKVQNVYDGGIGSEYVLRSHVGGLKQEYLARGSEGIYPR